MIEDRAADNFVHCFQNRMATLRCCISCDRIAQVLAFQVLAFGVKMEFTALFLATMVVMPAAWRGSRPLALGLFALAIIASLATYLHHATDTLKLSF